MTYRRMGQTLLIALLVLYLLGWGIQGWRAWITPVPCVLAHIGACPLSTPTPAR